MRRSPGQRGSLSGPSGPAAATRVIWDPVLTGHERLRVRLACRTGSDQAGQVNNSPCRVTCVNARCSGLLARRVRRFGSLLGKLFIRASEPLAVRLPSHSVVHDHAWWPGFPGAGIDFTSSWDQHEISRSG